ncbi:MAG: DivIVA domain-containing protein [Propionibacteriaceae bacterium]|nr:DivIVA domain-containing protein [Propionibacteriaceae bacterium]
MSLTLDEVRQIRFRMSRRGETGYQVGDVDTFIDKVELTFDEFEKERERMRRELDSMQSTSVQPAVVDDSELRNALQEKDNEVASLRGEVERLNAALSNSGDASAAQLAAEERVRELTAENDQLRSQLDQVRTEFDRVRSERVTQAVGGAETITVTSSEEAAPAVTRLLQMATDQATTLVNEAQAEAQRKIAEAEQRAAEIKTDARTKAERVESEARVNAEQMTKDAEGRAADVDRQANERRHQLFSDLEREQGELTGKVDALRSFETNYRQNLSGSLQRFLSSLNDDRPEPGDVPELAQQSETPRLDALAHGDQG